MSKSSSPHETLHVVGAMTSWWRALLVIGLVGCLPTKKNPDFCNSNDECDPGSICNLDTHGCEAPPDAPDADPDATTARCNPAAQFGTPELMPGVNSGFTERSLTMTYDELHAFIVRDEMVRFRSVTTSRASPDADFPAPVEDPMLAAIPPGAGQVTLLWPARSGLLMYFLHQGRPYVAERTATTEAFLQGRAIVIDNIAAPQLAGVDIQPSPDALSLYWVDANDHRLRVAQNASEPRFFKAASQMSTMPMIAALLSANELTLYYMPEGTDDVHVSKRLSTSIPFDPGTLIPTLSAEPGFPSFVTRDECVIYLSREGAANGDFFIARRPR